MNSKYISPFPTLNFPIYSGPNRTDNLIYEAWHEYMCLWLDSSRESEFITKPHINIYSGAEGFPTQALAKLHSESPIARIDGTERESSGTEHWEDYDDVVVLAEHPYILYATSAADNQTPIGFIQFNVSIRYYPLEKDISVYCYIERIYVAKEKRRQHAGAALIFATAEIIQKHSEEVLSQCKIMPESCPPVEELEIYLYAELHSEEGENMVNLLNSELEVFIDDYKMEHGDEQIKIKGVDLEAGF
ncbi:GNAT family N-acetyltransferase [Maridesulfovibrio sp.]|uniref:GNAT family N-acetyltransferase n=1 Tax=Maridesulfovibrio sp. TaxID=2795000 RepID=UPI0039EE1F1C